MAAQNLTIKLFRGDNTSWGFRLQGGKDFNSPISVQKVNPGSLAEQAGLMPGDVIMKIMGHSTDNLRHKEGQDAIIRAGNNIELYVQRGGLRVWKPTVTPIGDLPSVTTPPTTGLYTKTSLAHKNQESAAPIGTKHNVSPKPFASLGGGKVLVNNQYNTPAPLYSMNNIAETLSAHTEVLATGAMGINFMKDPQPVNKDSAVYRMIMEEKSSASEQFNHVDRKDSQVNKAPMSTAPMMQAPKVTQHVSAPITKPPSEMGDRPLPPNSCPECGKPIIGVFVRIKDKSLHPECFKCSTCGTSLKNVGYFNVNDKLYCDAHAKLAAKIASSVPTYEPSTMSQQTDFPQPPLPNMGSVAPQTPISTPLSPTTFRSVSPVPFHRSGDLHHVDAPTSPQPALTPPVFKPAPPFSAASTGPSIKQIPIQQPTSQLSNFGGTTVTGQGHKFVWPPQKNAPDSEPALASNSTPTLPTYRPPPGTQHAVPKYSSPLSPTTPQISSPTFPKPASPTISPGIKTSSPTFGTAFSTAAPMKVVPVVGPKPRNPTVQSNKAWSSTTTSSMVTKTSISSESGLQSGVPMTVGAGSRPAPKRGRGQMKPQVSQGARIPICNICGTPIRGPFVLALGKSWCPDHFLCANNRCRTSLVNIGFVEDRGQLYCENCFEQHLAPICAKCNCRIKGDCLNALEKQWHTNCFICCYCNKPFGNSSFYMEDGLPYCEKDWNELFTTKCVGCGFPIEAGDRWVEALNSNYHSQCFKCTKCLKGLEGQSFYAKSGRPYCKAHSRD